MRLNVWISLELILKFYKLMRKIDRIFIHCTAGSQR
nr:MAG TPA: putative phosphatase [Caudoviricetes sp.]